MGQPYLLGDKDPRDPVKGWDKTWAFLKELNTCIEYYTAGTGPMMKELGEGSRDMTVTMTGWDLNPRILGIVPKDFKVTPFKNMTWVNDAHYMAVPKGVPAEKLAVLLDLMAYLLTPEAQGPDLRQGLLLSRPVGEERAPVDGAEGKPGRDSRIRTPGVRRMAGAVSARPDASMPRRWSRHSAGGTAKSERRRRSDTEVRTMKHDFNDLRLDRVTRRFAGAGGHAFAALNELTLTVKRGEFICLLGPSGLRQVDGAQLHRGASCSFRAGASGSTSSASTRSPPEKRGFGMVFQNYALFSAHERGQEHRLRIAHARRERGGGRGRGSRTALKLVQLTGQSTSCPDSSPVASSSASPSPAPS